MIKITFCTLNQVGSVRVHQGESYLTDYNPLAPITHRDTEIDNFFLGNSHGIKSSEKKRAASGQEAEMKHHVFMRFIQSAASLL